MQSIGTRNERVWQHTGLRGWCAVLAVAVSLVSGPLWAAEEEGNNGQDPTKPLTRLDFRYQYQNLPPDDHDNANIFTFRADKPFVLAPGVSLSTRLDLPLFLTDALSSDNPGGASLFGVGDMLLQGLLIYAPSPRFAMAASYFPGTDVVVPLLAFSGISIPMNMLFALITGRMLRDTEARARPVEA